MNEGGIEAEVAEVDTEAMAFDVDGVYVDGGVIECNPEGFFWVGGDAEFFGEAVGGAHGYDAEGDCLMDELFGYEFDGAVATYGDYFGEGVCGEQVAQFLCIVGAGCFEHYGVELVQGLCLPDKGPEDVFVFATCDGVDNEEYFFC